MHRRLEGQETSDGLGESTSLAYSEDDFRGFCKDLRQHRTLSLILARKSTAVFSCRSVIWEDPDDFGHSTGMLFIPGPNDWGKRGQFVISIPQYPKLL